MSTLTGYATLAGNPETDALIYGVRWESARGGVLSYSFAGLSSLWDASYSYGIGSEPGTGFAPFSSYVFLHELGHALGLKQSHAQSPLDGAALGGLEDTPIVLLDPCPSSVARMVAVDGGERADRIFFWANRASLTKARRWAGVNEKHPIHAMSQ